MSYQDAMDRTMLLSCLPNGNSASSMSAYQSTKYSTTFLIRVTGGTWAVCTGMLNGTNYTSCKLIYAQCEHRIGHDKLKLVIDHSENEIGHNDIRFALVEVRIGYVEIKIDHCIHRIG